MSLAKLTSKWQMVMPKPIREYLELQPGDGVEFIINESGQVIVRPIDCDVRELKGLLKRNNGKVVSVEDMKKAVRERAVRALC